MPSSLQPITSLALKAGPCTVSFLMSFFAWVSCRGQASGEAVPEIQGDGEEICLRGFCFLQLQCPSVVSGLDFVEGSRNRLVGWCETGRESSQLCGC